jgi:hypothetical protein
VVDLSVAISSLVQCQTRSSSYFVDYATRTSHGVQAACFGWQHVPSNGACLLLTRANIGRLCPKVSHAHPNLFCLSRVRGIVTLPSVSGAGQAATLGLCISAPWLCAPCAVGTTLQGLIGARVVINVADARPPVLSGGGSPSPACCRADGWTACQLTETITHLMGLAFRPPQTLKRNQPDTLSDWPGGGDA